MESATSPSSRSAPLLMLQIFRSVVDDPVARAAPAPADIIDRPSSIVAPNLRTTIPLKRKWRRRPQPYSRLEPVGLLGRTARWNRRASRARVWAESQVNAAIMSRGHYA